MWMTSVLVKHQSCYFTIGCIDFDVTLIKEQIVEVGTFMFDMHPPIKMACLL